MIALVWGALQSKLAGPVAAAIAVALACFLLAASLQIVGLKHKVGKLGAERDAAIANYARCQSNRVTLETAIAAQNSAVRAIADEAARKTQAAEKALSEARRATAAANRRIGGIMAARPGPDACESADRLIMETIR